MIRKPTGVRSIVRFAALTLLAGLTSCAPQAIFFHEATKVGFSATYNVSDAQPVSSHFGFKRRIVAVMPGQERVPAASGKEEDATNRGDALSLVSKFYVKVGTRLEGVQIRTNFASGNAARALTASKGSSRAVEALMHNQVVVTPEVKNVEEIRRIQSHRTKVPSQPSTREISPQTNPPTPETLPETPEPSPTATPTLPPAIREVGPDAVPTVKPTATPTLPPARREVGVDGIIRAKPTPTATLPPATREVGPDGTIKPKPNQ